MDSPSATHKALKQKRVETQILMIDFICVFVLSILWSLNRGLTWQPLLLFLPSLYLHLKHHFFIIKRKIWTVLFPAVIFLIVAGVSVTVSYDPQGATKKFLVILGACLLFGIISLQPLENIHKIIIVTGVFGGLWTIFFLLTQQWELRVVDVDLVNKVVAKWAAIRPSIFQSFQQNEDTLGGILAIFLPSLISVWILRRKYKGAFEETLTWIALILVLAGVFVSGSRPAWVGLILSMGFGALLFFLFFTTPNIRKWAAVGGGVVLIFVILLGVMLNFKESSVFFGSRISNSTSLEERQSLYQNVIYLVRDFFFTGSGLASFSGVYSQYILKISNLYLSYGHHLYLDLWLEMGLVGFLSFVFIQVQNIFISLKTYVKDEDAERGILRIGVLSSVVCLLFSGFFEDAVFGLGGTAFLIFLPGIMAALNCDFREKDISVQARGIERPQRNRVYALGVTVIIVVAVFAVFRNEFLAMWYSNLGSVALAKTSLNGWPEQAPGDFDNIETQSAERFFDKAFQYDSENVTSNYREGIIAFRRQDFITARDYLGKAFREDSEHIGILKYFAYSQLWSGAEQDAYPLFLKIPNAKQELQTYGTWLESIRKTELSEIAFALADQLE